MFQISTVRLDNLPRHYRHHTVPDPCHLLPDRISVSVIIPVYDIALWEPLHPLQLLWFQHTQEDIGYGVLLAFDHYIHKSEPILCGYRAKRDI